MSDKTRSTSAVSAKRVAGVLGGLGVGALGGFVASLLRRRPPTIYTAGLESSEPRDEDTGLPESGASPTEGPAEGLVGGRVEGHRGSGAPRVAGRGS